MSNINWTKLFKQTLQQIIASPPDQLSEAISNAASVVRASTVYSLTELDKCLAGEWNRASLAFDWNEAPLGFYHWQNLCSGATEPTEADYQCIEAMRQDYILTKLLVEATNTKSNS